ncbi:MAG: dacB 2 [Rickettsiaceae bacterium]|jgi:PBP4 family serine-type D-alanyl-D-alanine carboxypeptidase|nr:dacB 2 [Rickettsiaceae bacterium]
MQLIKTLILTIFVFIYQQSSYANNIKAEIEQLIEETDPHLNIGVKIVDLKNQKILYETNGNRFYNFASSLKVLLTASAIEYFGENYEIKSSIKKSGANYLLDIGDDPGFSDADLDILISKLKTNKVDIIDGNFYIIKREFKLPSSSPYKVVVDSHYCYGAHTSRTHINKNCFPLTAAPGKVGEKLKLSTPYKNLFSLSNKAVTIKDKSVKARILREVEGSTIYVNGTLNESSSPISINPVINDNIKYLTLFIKYYLEKHGVKLKGKILPINQEPAGRESELVAENKKDLRTIYRTILKKSDNYLSDYLFQLISANNIFDEWFEAGEYIKQFVAKRFKIDLNKAVIMDGSGISRLNMLTPNQMSDLLGSIAQKPYFNNFKESMAKPQEEGTLQERFKDFPYKLFAKTGSMRGIYSLVGYIEKDEALYSFVIVANNAMGQKEIYSKLEEAILNTIKA